MPVPVTPYPPAPPTVDANGIITIDQFLNQPTRVRRVLQNLALQRFVADVIFGPGPSVSGGAVLYDEVTANDLYTARDAQEIAAGGEYPILTDEAPVPKMASVRKWGGRIFITDEQRDRNELNVLNRELTKLRNTIVRKVDSVAFAALDASPKLTLTGADWSNTANDPIAQIVDARAMVNDQDLGYEVDTAIINPAQEADLLKRDDFRKTLSPASQDAIVRGANIGQIMTIDFIKSNRVPAGTAWILQRRIVGGISDEQPLASKTYRQEDSDKTWVQASRRLVPYVTDPKAVVKLTSI